MTSIFQDKENQTLSYNGPLKGPPKTPFQRKAGVMRTPFATKPKENINVYQNPGKSVLQDTSSKFKTPNENRVPLGGKDANVRPNITGLPTKQKSAIKQTSGRRRTKQIVRQDVVPQSASVPAAVVVEELPDIEYMPPRAIELPFFPEDFESLDYNALDQQLRTGNLADYFHPRDKNGMTSMDRKLNQMLKFPNNDFIEDDLKDFAVGDDGLYGFDRPLAIGDDDIDWQDFKLSLDDDMGDMPNSK
ncbi:hypothetical protein V1512DRAFT_256141 [Lipomyces arxii]|uniref:uncharacterized protein n=1 Tax=Lipomyces arxii TaxID=56418 RepID=UPI0034CE5790